LSKWRQCNLIRQFSMCANFMVPHLMLMDMVQVGLVRVVVPHRFMRVPVAVRANWHRGMDMGVVSVIMGMGMGVFVPQPGRSGNVFLLPVTRDLSGAIPLCQDRCRLPQGECVSL